MALLKAGAEADKKDTDGHTALDLAPDKEARPPRITPIGSDIHVLAAGLTGSRSRSTLSGWRRLRVLSYDEVEVTLASPPEHRTARIGNRIS